MVCGDSFSCWVPAVTGPLANTFPFQITYKVQVMNCLVETLGILNENIQSTFWELIIGYRTYTIAHHAINEE